jgi:hypothetical protein
MTWSMADVRASSMLDSTESEVLAENSSADRVVTEVKATIIRTHPIVNATHRGQVHLEGDGRGDMVLGH